MDPTTIAAIIGSVTGVLALLIYFIKIGGIITMVNTLWEKNIPEQLKELSTRTNTLWEKNIPEQLKELSTRTNTLWEKNIPEQLKELNTRTNTLWKVYIEDRLQEMPREYTGSYYLTIKGEEILPADLKEELKEIAKSEKFEHIDSVGDIVPLIIEEKIDSLRNVSASANISIGDAAILASLYAFKVKILDELLSGDYSKIDASAIKKMPDSSKQQYLDEIILKLEDKNPDKRRSVVMALGRIGDPRAVDALIEVLKEDPDVSVRWNTAVALGSIGDARAVDALIEVLKEDADIVVLRNAIEALGCIGDPRAVDVLTNVSLKHRRVGVRSDAKKAIEEIRAKQK